MPKFLPILLLLLMAGFARAQDQTITDGSRTAPISFGAGPCVYNWTNSDPSIGLPATGTGDITSFTAVNKTGAPIKARIVATPERKPYAFILATSGVLTLIDLKTNLVASSLSIPYASYGEVISPDGKTLYVTNPWGGELIMIDAQDYRTLGNIKLNNQPRGIALSPDGSKIYVTTQNGGNPSGLFRVVDAATFTVTGTVVIDANPLGVTISADGKTAYVAQTTTSKLAVIDLATNTITANVPVGFGPVVSVLSKDGKMIYVSNTIGTSVTAVSTVTNTVVDNFDVGRKPSGIVLTPNQRYLYLVNNIEKTVTVFDLQTKTIAKIIDLIGGDSPSSMALTPDGTQAYVVNTNGMISIINTTTNTLVASTMTPNGALAFGNFMSEGINCNTGPITIEITVKPSTAPKATISGTATGLTSTYGTASNTSKLTVDGSDLTAPLIITAPAGAELSLDGITFTPTLTLPPDANGSLVNVPIFTRISATAPAGTYNADLTLSGSGGLNQKKSISGAISKAQLTITAKPATKKYGDGLTGGPGSTAFTATGLKNNEIISTVTTTYGSAGLATANIGTYTGLAVANTPVGAGFNSANYNISESHADVVVDRAPLQIKADDRSRQLGRPNPALTLTYTGFVNNDGPAQLITQPIVGTDATPASPKGKYTITVSGATARNYLITEVPGTLTVHGNSADGIVIPNTFTPNGDGINDKWAIADLQYYPSCTVSIFNRLGAQLYYSNGYAQAWDGTSKGSPLPAGTYYYLIQISGVEQKLSGAVAIVR